MKKIISSVIVLLVMAAGVCNAQASKEEDFMKAFFEALKNNDKKTLKESLMLKESDLDAYNESQKNIGSTKVFTKGDFEKFVAEKNDKISREFDALYKNALNSKITFENTKFGSYRKIADPAADVPAGYYRIVFKFHDVYSFKMQLECVPVGDGLRLYNVLDTVTM